MSDNKPVIGELWTDHPNLPHGTRVQVEAWLLAAWNPRLVRVTATSPSHGIVAPGMVAYADGLGREQVMEVDQFMRSFRRVPDSPPDPWDIPPEVPR